MNQDDMNSSIYCRQLAFLSRGDFKVCLYLIVNLSHQIYPLLKIKGFPINIDICAPLTITFLTLCQIQIKLPPPNYIGCFSNRVRCYEHCFIMFCFQHQQRVRPVRRNLMDYRMTSWGTKGQTSPQNISAPLGNKHFHTSQCCAHV